MACLEDLPIELINRIFDHLDMNSIISFSLTCQRYLNYLNNSNKYQINFQSISKSRFDLICRLINPSNIIALTLSDNDQTPGQIQIFLQTIRINELNRLKSLKLIEMNENDLENVLKDLSNKLKSFEIEQSEVILDEIQSLRVLMDELVHLKLEGFTHSVGQFFKDDQLEKFFHRKMESFQFFIRFSPTELIRDNQMIESFLQQFEKSNWISHFNSSVNADWIRNSNEIHFYSLPSINSSFKYSDQLNFISFSTFPSSTNNHQRFDTVNHLELNLKDLEIRSTKNAAEGRRLFPQLRSLKLLISDQCSFNSFQFLSQLIHLEKLVEVVLIICSRGSYLNSMIKNFLNLFETLSNVHSIEIFNRWHEIFSFIDLNEFCSMIPKNIKHLNIDIIDVHHIKILIEQFEHLSSLKLKFSFEKSLLIKDVLQWLTTRRMNCTYRADIHYLSIWISQQSNQIHSNKRIKLDD